MCCGVQGHGYNLVPFSACRCSIEVCWACITYVCMHVCWGVCACMHFSPMTGVTRQRQCIISELYIIITTQAKHMGVTHSLACICVLVYTIITIIIIIIDCCFLFLSNPSHITCWVPGPHTNVCSSAPWERAHCSSTIWTSMS